MNSESLQRNNSDKPIDTIRLEFEKINRNNPGKVHTVLIEVNSNKDIECFSILTSDPQIKFSEEAHSYLGEGNLKNFIDIARENFFKIYEE